MIGLMLGSSPRVRGTQNVPPVNSGIFRFIPACAGNTLCDTSVIIFVTVHPRVCGEHYFANNDKFHAVGSSPRVRGTLLQTILKHTMSRFIPACAGNTIVLFLHFILHSVHPRVCGEHSYR